MTKINHIPRIENVHTTKAFVRYGCFSSFIKLSIYRIVRKIILIPIILIVCKNYVRLKLI